MTRSLRRRTRAWSAFRSSACSRSACARSVSRRGCTSPSPARFSCRRLTANSVALSRKALRQALRPPHDGAGGQKFTLTDAGGEDEGEGLTHLGRSLGDDIRTLLDVGRASLWRTRSRCCMACTLPASGDGAVACL
jgi:hypothetical protein